MKLVKITSKMDIDVRQFYLVFYSHGTFVDESQKDVVPHMKMTTVKVPDTALKLRLSFKK